MSKSLKSAYLSHEKRIKTLINIMDDAYELEPNDYGFNEEKAKEMRQRKSMFIALLNDLRKIPIHQRESMNLELFYDLSTVPEYQRERMGLGLDVDLSRVTKSQRDRMNLGTHDIAPKFPDFDKIEEELYGLRLLSAFIKEMQDYFSAIFHCEETKCALKNNHEFDEDYRWIKRIMEYEFKPYPPLRIQIDAQRIDFGYFEVILFLYHARSFRLQEIDQIWIIKKLTSVKDGFKLKRKKIFDIPIPECKLEKLQEFLGDLEYLRGTFDFYSNLGAEIQTLKDEIEKLKIEIKKRTG